MFIFGLLYIVSFFTAIYKLLKGVQGAILIFFIVALPIYITGLSTINMYGFTKAIPILQSFKEFIVALALVLLLWNKQKKINLVLVDWLVIAYFAYNCIYIILPVGSYNLIQKLIAFKGICFFPFVYFVGRFCDLKQINVLKWYKLLCVLGILTGVVLLFEVIPYMHLQTYTGYAAYNQQFMNVEPAGNYGLTWTFESINGIKRFASFYSMPLEHAAATLITISVIAALSTRRKNKLVFTKLTIITLFFTLFSIVFAFSRAAFASYFLMIYIYLMITKNKKMLQWVHIGFLVIAVAFFIWIKGDLYEVVTTTIDFTDSSSVSHLIEWIAGIQAIGSNPFGLGLGTSGRIAGSFAENIGGENQLIIIGVQTGIISILLYIVIYWQVIKNGFILFQTGSSSKGKKISLMIVLLKIGMIIPLLTAEVEIYIYVSYIIWFFSGLLISMRSTEQVTKNKYHALEGGN